MSSAVSHWQPTDRLPEDVLAEIFSYIDGDELLDLQIVCRRWHQVISTLINWKCVLEQKLRSSVTWRQVEKRLDHSAPETRTDYRLLYRNIRRKVQQLDHNWRTGKFSELDIQIDGERSNGADDDFLVNFQDGNVVVYDRRRMQILRKMSGYYDSYLSRIHKGRLFLTENGRGYVMVDVKTGTKLNKLGNALFIHQIAICDWGLMAIVGDGRVSYSNSMLQMWAVTARASKLCRETEYDRSRIRVELDNQVMAIFTVDSYSNRVHPKPVTILIIDHFDDLTRSFGVRRGAQEEIAFHYGQGIFFLIHRDGRIRLMNVSTGQWLRTIRHQPWKYFVDAALSLQWTPMALNSKFIAILDVEEKTGNSTMFIYDLEAAKDPSADSGGLPLVIIHIPGFLFRRLQINETEIYGIGERNRRGENGLFKAFDFFDSGTSHEVICSITKRGRVVRKPARYGQVQVALRTDVVSFATK